MKETFYFYSIKNTLYCLDLQEVCIVYYLQTVIEINIAQNNRYKQILWS